MFELVTEHNLFTAVQDQAMLLVEFDKEKAVGMLVEHTYSIPVRLSPALFFPFFSLALLPSSSSFASLRFLCVLHAVERCIDGLIGCESCTAA